MPIFDLCTMIQMIIKLRDSAGLRKIGTLTCQHSFYDSLVIWYVSNLWRKEIMQQKKDCSICKTHTIVYNMEQVFSVMLRTWIGCIRWCEANGIDTIAKIYGMSVHDYSDFWQSDKIKINMLVFCGMI